MDKIKRPRGLVRYASLNSIERGESFKITGRMIGYGVALCALTTILLTLVFTRSDVQTTLLRAPGALYQQTAQGEISNLYILKLINKTSRDIAVGLRLRDRAGKIQLMGGSQTLNVPKGQLAQTSVLVQMPRSAVLGPAEALVIDVYADGELTETVKTVFTGPRQ